MGGHPPRPQLYPPVSAQPGSGPSPLRAAGGRRLLTAPILRPLLLLTLLALPTLFAPAAKAGQANVFVYHRFGDARYPSTNISLEAFSEQLRYLRDHEYHVLPLGEIVRRLGAGLPLPKRCAALTVDDAYDSFLAGAMPLLRRYGYPATLFVSSDLVGRPGYLDWDQLRALQGEGVEIGNHSASHDYLLDRRRDEGEEEWRRRVREDVIRAQLKLQKEMGQAPRLFAYPFGEYAPALVEIIREIGFAGAAAQQSGVVTGRSPRLVLPRFPMGGPYATLEEFREKLRMKALPVTVVSPGSPVLGEQNPPVLILDIEGPGIDLDRLRCFVPGQSPATIVRDAGNPGRFTVFAKKPLSGRRSKYTLTAPGEGGAGWYWFSQLWIRPEGLSAGGFLE